MMTRAHVCSGEGSILMGGELKVEVTFDARQPLTGITFGVVVKNCRFASVFGVNNIVVPSPELDRTVRRGTVTCCFPNVSLMPGTYYIDLYIGTKGHNLDVVHEACKFEVLPANVFGSGKLPPTNCGDVYYPATLRLSDNDSLYS